MGSKRQGLWSLLATIPERFRALSLATQFLIVGGAVLCGGMAILGSWITSAISASTLDSAAKSSSVFMETFLEPYVQDLPPEGVMAPGPAARLDRVLPRTPLGDRLVAVKIWRADGTIVYSTNKELVGRNFDAPAVARAAGGEVVATYEDLAGHEGASERATGLPLLEVYAPLHRMGTDELIAVGEYYENAPWFAAQLRRAQAATWLVVGATTAAMIGILFLIVSRGSSTIASQREQLGQRIAEADLLAAQNENLRIDADQARLDANEANEQLLARIGSDLHDGPIQMLSLLTLRLSAGVEGAPPGDDDEDGAHRPALIARDVLSELRTISAGLILPEISRIDLRGALQLAIFRHEDITGTKVVTQLRNLPKRLPLALKTCAYRVVQEALSNAYKHAGDVRTEVRARVVGDQLEIVVADAGPGFDVEERVVGGHDKLGLAGIRNRVSALKGSLEVETRPRGGVRLTVLLPLDP